MYIFIEIIVKLTFMVTPSRRMYYAIQATRW